MCPTAAKRAREAPGGGATGARPGDARERAALRQLLEHRSYTSLDVDTSCLFPALRQGSGSYFLFCGVGGRLFGGICLEVCGGGDCTSGVAWRCSRIPRPSFPPSDPEGNSARARIREQAASPGGQVAGKPGSLVGGHMAGLGGGPDRWTGRCMMTVGS